jgi:hypothetical protein
MSLQTAANSMETGMTSEEIGNGFRKREFESYTIIGLVSTIRRKSR